MWGSTIERQWRRIAGWALLVVVAAVGTVCAGTGDVDRLNGKTDEILRMHTAIQERYSQAVRIRRQLEGMRNDLTAEIVKERAQGRPADFSQAIRTPRIAYDLRLVRRLTAFIRLLDERIDYFQKALDTLGFFQGRAQDDLMVLHSVRNITLDPFVQKIDRTLREYASAVESCLIDAGGLKLEKLENTWQHLP